MVKERFVEWTDPVADEPAAAPGPDRVSATRWSACSADGRRTPSDAELARQPARARAPGCVPRRSCPSHERRHGRSQGAPGCATCDNGVARRAARAGPVTGPSAPSAPQPRVRACSVVDPAIGPPAPPRTHRSLVPRHPRAPRRCSRSSRSTSCSPRGSSSSTASRTASARQQARYQQRRLAVAEALVASSDRRPGECDSAWSTRPVRPSPVDGAGAIRRPRRRRPPATSSTEADETREDEPR